MKLPVKLGCHGRNVLALILFCPLLGWGLGSTASAAPAYSQIVVFGDSLSDTGNFADTTESEFDIRYPGNDFNYADGRFTDDTSTTPAAKKYTGVWHEQLASLFLDMAPATASLDGGTDYAFGDAETTDGERTVALEEGLSIQVDNLNQQVTNYLAATPTADPAALYIVWAGANDLFEDDSSANVTAAAAREAAVVRRLAEAGASTILVPNLPPLGLTPEYSGDAATAAALTAAASSFRDQLNADLDALLTTLAAEGFATKVYRLDVFDLFNRLTASAGLDYGFSDLTDSAQGADVKADTSLFWDDVHPTTFGHFQLAAEAFTVLSGTPVIELFRSSASLDRNDQAGSFLLTRTGVDLSQTLSVNYTVTGTAAPGTDYAALKDHKNVKAGKRTVKINLDPTSASGEGTVKVKLVLQPGTGYVLPVVKGSGINLTD